MTLQNEINSFHERHGTWMAVFRDEPLKHYSYLSRHAKRRYREYKESLPEGHEPMSMKQWAKGCDDELVKAWLRGKEGVR